MNISKAKHKVTTAHPPTPQNHVGLNRAYGYLEASSLILLKVCKELRWALA